MLINEILNTYSIEDFTTVALTEAVGDWTITHSTAYKRGYKKHSKDSRVVNSMNALIDFITSHEGVPPVRSYPIEFNVHMLRQNDWKPNALWAHIKGQQVGVGFYVTPGLIELFCLGSHRECNV